MKRKAVILVAGLGTRLRPLTDTTHKCLTEVNGVEILDNCLKNLNAMEFAEATLVIGYLGEKIKNRIGTEYENLIINYAENKEFATTNTSASLLIGIKEVGPYDELYVLEGDVFFDKSVLGLLVEDDHENATILESYNDTLSGTFVGLGKDGFVKEWKHKSVQGNSFPVGEKYKTVNIHKFSRRFVDGVIIPALEKSVNKKAGKSPLEYVMDEIVETNNSAIYGKVLHGQKWFEIDDQNDLLIAEKMFSNSN